MKEGITVLLVSHKLEMIRKYCDRVVWIEEGKIKREGEVKGVVEDYEK